MELDRDKMQQLLQFWQTHQQEAARDHASEHALKIASEDEADLEWDHDQSLQECRPGSMTSMRLPQFATHATCKGICATIKRRGVAWVQYLERLGLNPCLADDMGLGKTLEVIACLLKEREEASDLPPELWSSRRLRCWATGAKKSSVSRPSFACWCIKAAYD